VTPLYLRAELLAAPQKRIPAEGDDDPAAHEPNPPIVSAMRAFPVCIRFSASS
jgi:hypothetical protein